MTQKTSPLQLTEEQALYFRARRGYLTDEGAQTPEVCARNLIGLQSQQLAPGLLAICQRMAGKPTAKELEAHLFSPERDLVRTWGQRGTIHIYDAQDSWAKMISARRQWYSDGRRGLMPSKKSEKRALDFALKKGAVVKDDLLPFVEDSYVEDLDPRIGDESARAKFAAGRLAWRLSLEGQLCQGERQGSRQIYAARQEWFPDLDWPNPLPVPQKVCVEFVRRYLAVNAPATVHDMAHYFGTKISTARLWVADLQENGELISVQCGDRKDLLALAEDELELQKKPGKSAKAWPMRLLPLWDTLLMSHRDKSWTVPDESMRSLVWCKAAYVSAVALDRGRVVGVWSMKRRGEYLDFELNPLAGWSKSKHGQAFIREVQAVGRHLELPVGTLK
jgi:hypothetical protein